jgi:hypothetical protein
MRHRDVLTATLGGLLCLPATWTFTRTGPLLASFVIVLAIALAAGFLGAHRLRSMTRFVLFSVGAVLSESAFFLYYYFTYGQTDPKLGAGITVTFIELFCIIAIGGAAILLAPMLMRKEGNRAA